MYVVHVDSNTYDKVKNVNKLFLETSKGMWQYAEIRELIWSPIKHL